MPRIIAAIGDLMFRSKVDEAAKALNIQITYVRDASEVIEQLRMGTPGLMILDLNAAKLHPLDTLLTLRQNAAFEAIPIVGYAGHVQTELMEQARQLGCSSVLTNGQFAAQLPELLKSAR